MAATVLLLLSRVLLLGILFTEVLGAGTAANGSSSSSRRSKSENAVGLWLEIKPRGGELLLGAARRNRAATLSCAASASLLQDVERVGWLYNGEAAPPCGPHQRCNLQRNGSLRLGKKKLPAGTGSGSSSSSGNRNEYRCIAHTSYGGALRSAPTHVLYAELAMEFDESPPEQLAVHEGQVARLACRIGSVPSPANVTWYRDGRAIAAADPPLVSAGLVVLPASGLLFIEAARQSDAGSYRCEAANRFANATRRSKQARLMVLPRPPAGGSLPVALFPQVSRSYSPPLNASSLLLACAASGYPRPNASWTFIAKQRTGGKQQQPVRLHSASGLSLLQLSNIGPEAAGTYVCSVDNFTDKSTQTQSISVDVLVPPTFIKKPSNQICPNGRTARFECQAQGYPTPRIYWLKDAVDITSSSSNGISGRRTVYVKEFNKMELAISATVPSDSGIYQCVAVNAAGEIWAAGRLRVNQSRNSPAAPTLLKCEALSPVKVFISWQPPKLLPFNNITAYTVHYRPVDGGKEEVSPPEPGNSTSVQVTKLLEPFTNYTFYVRLWNNHGASDQSATITCSTKASVPRSAPKVFADALSSTKLNVTWKPLTKKEAQGIVTEYKLEWRLYHHPSARVLTVPASVEQYVLTDLIPGEQYQLRVLARTELGWPNVDESQLGWLNVEMPPSTDAVEAQIYVINSTAIKFKWDFKSNSIFQLDSWNIVLKKEDNSIVESANFTKDATEYEFTNLEPEVMYVMELCALNAYADKVNCIRKRAQLKKMTTSNAPTALEAIPLTANSIGISWVSKSINVSNLFEICYNPVQHLSSSSSSSEESAICTRVNVTRVVIQNLKPFTLYQFRLKALSNDAGGNDDDYSESIECCTNEDVPGKVEDVEWFLINSTLVRIAWKEPKTINGVIQRYYVAYSMDRNMYDEPKSAAWNNVTVFGNKTSISLPTLGHGKRYFVVIQAATRAGAGNPSEPIIIVTGDGGSFPNVPPSSLDETKSLSKTGQDRKLGIILGIAISITSIFVCLCSIYCRKKYESLRSLRESAQPLKTRVLTTRNGGGNACCVSRSSCSQPVAAAVTAAAIGNEIELAVLFPSTPISTNPLCDTKGVGHANGILESKEPLLSSWEMNGLIKDVRITENPQHEHLTDMNSTQQTTVDSDFAGSESSFNNNMSNCASESAGEVLTAKTGPTIVPVLEPNG